MIFVDVAFPECIGFGAESAPEWDTGVTPVLSGRESTQQNWADAKHVFNVPFAARPASDYLAIKAHFNTMRGRAKSFPVKDFLDYQVAVTEGELLDVVTLLAPTANGTFGLFKKYGTGSDAYHRRITRPDSPIIVRRNGTNITGTGAAVTYAGGTVVITGHTGGDVYTWSGTFKVPARYDADKLPGIAINKSGSEIVVECGPISVVEILE